MDRILNLDIDAKYLDIDMMQWVHNSGFLTEDWISAEVIKSNQIQEKKTKGWKATSLLVACLLILPRIKFNVSNYTIPDILRHF